MERKKHSNFVNQIFDIWYDLDDPNFHIREFMSIIMALLGGKHNSCLLAGNCIGKYFDINFNGDIYHCDEFMNDSDYKIGNVINDSLDSIISNSKLLDLKKKNKEQISEINCKWKSICNGGCPKDRYVSNLFSKSTVDCCGYSDLIEHIAKRISEDLEKNIIMKINS